MSSDPSGITPTINHRKYRDLLVRFGVIDREWKGLAQQAVIISVGDSVDSGSNSQTLNVRLDRTQEVVPEADLLQFVERKTLVQIPARGSSDSDHAFRRDGRESLIESQSRSGSRPSSTARRRSSSRSRCHCGTGTCSACARKSSQIASMIWSFSANGSCLTSAMLIIPSPYAPVRELTTLSANAQHQRWEPPTAPEL